MPCYEPRDSSRSRTEVIYSTGISPKDMSEVTDRNEWLEAALCALFNELQKREILNSVIAESSRNGLVGLMDFWQEHQKSDESRLAKALHSFSKDEQEILKKLLNGNK